MTAPSLTGAPVLTVITPTYNRAHLIERIYRSLLRQTDKSFEWIIVDDGSSDNTMQVVTRWINAAPFKITYVKQHNQGKPAAYNHAVRLACGELLACLDSDDWFPDDGVENRIKLMQLYINNPKICGVSGLAEKADGALVGQPFPNDGIIGSKQLLNVLSPGDKPTTFKTSVLKQFPFPQFPNEKFLPESSVYNRMFQSGYKFASSNKILTIVDYQKGGLSDTALELRLNNINGTLMYYHEMSLMDFPSLLNLRAKSNLVRYIIHKIGKIKFLKYFALLIISIPVGCLLYLKDKNSARVRAG